MKFNITRLTKIVPDAFHGTDLDSAERIAQTGKFLPSHGDQQYLGDGIYFFESSSYNAINWARDKKKVSSIGVIKSTIALGRCLDLHNSEHTKLIRSVARDLSEKRKRRDITDAFVINFIVKMSDDTIDTVRATHIPGIRKKPLGNLKIFSGSHFLMEQSLIICVKNHCSIMNCDFYHRERDYG